jgi:hypothetical protein
MPAQSRYLLREVAGRLAASGAWKPGDPDIIVVMDAGYDVIRLAWLLADLPLVLCARLRSTRVFHREPAPKPPHMGGPPREHGTPLRFTDPATWAGPSLTAAADTPRHDDPGPGPPRIPRRPRHSQHSRSPAQTRQTRPRTPQRIPNRHKAPSHDVGKRHPRGKHRTKRRTKANQPD